MMDILEHIEGDKEFLTHVDSRYNPGSKMLITVPALMELWSPHDESRGHFRRYTTDTFKQLIDFPDVTCQLMTGINTRLFPVVRTIRYFSRRRKNAFGNDNTDVKKPGPLVNNMLYNIFYGEHKRVGRQLSQGKQASINCSVSILSVLEKK